MAYLSLAAALVLCVLEPGAFENSARAEAGRASWYALTSQTASGERCDPDAMTAGIHRCHLAQSLSRIWRTHAMRRCA